MTQVAAGYGVALECIRIRVLEAWTALLLTARHSTSHRADSIPRLPKHQHEQLDRNRPQHRCCQGHREEQAGTHADRQTAGSVQATPTRLVASAEARDLIGQGGS